MVPSWTFSKFLTPVFKVGYCSISVSLNLFQFRSLELEPVKEEPQGRTGIVQLPSCPPSSRLPQQFTLHWLWGLPGPCPDLVSSPQSIPTSFPVCSPTAREEDLWPGRPHTCYPPSCWCSWPQVSTGDKDRGKEPGTGEGRGCKMGLYWKGGTHGVLWPATGSKMHPEHRHKEGPSLRREPLS